MLVRVSIEDAEIETGVKQVACPDTAGKAAPRQGHRLWIWDCSGDGSNSHLMAQILQATETAQKQQTSALTMSSPGLRAWGLHMPAPTSPTIPGGTPSHTLLPDAGVSPISHSPVPHTNTPHWFMQLHLRGAGLVSSAAQDAEVWHSAGSAAEGDASLGLNGLRQSQQSPVPKENCCYLLIVFSTYTSQRHSCSEPCTNMISLTASMGASAVI